MDALYQYRKLIVALASVLYAGLAVVSDALTAGTPLGGLTWWSVAVALATAAGIYFPRQVPAKLAAALVGAIGSTVAAALTDDRITSAEGVSILLAVVAFVAAGTVPNESAPELRPVLKKG
jgi:hypothetical protein